MPNPPESARTVTTTPASVTHTRTTPADTDETEQLVLQAAAGSKVATTALYQRYYARTYKFAMRHLGGDAHAAEDVCSEAWIAAVSSLHRYSPRKEADSFVSWLYGIVRNKVREHYRRVSHRPVAASDWLAGLDTPDGRAEHDPERVVFAKATAHEVEVALRVLSEKQRKVLIAKFWNNMTVVEIAQVYGMTESDVKVSAHRGVKALCTILGKNP